MLEKISLKPSAVALKYTGERFTSEVSGEIKHEHYHRYFFALQFCIGKSVLDIASGEGYGSALLASVASRVIGIDISAEAVAHASANYGCDTITFSVGECAAIPIGDASVDVVVSFETLEHIADQNRFLSEAKRVLRPGGILVISTPNVEVYKDIATTPNPFHLRELTESEFRQSISVHFPQYRLFGQRSVVGSAILPSNPELGDGDGQEIFRANGDTVYSIASGIGQPIYFIAVASDAPLPAIRHGLLDDRPFLMSLYALLQERTVGLLQEEHKVRASEALREVARKEIAELQLNLDRARADAEFHSRTVQKSREALKQRIARSLAYDQTKAELEVAKSELCNLEAQLTEAQAKRYWRISKIGRMSGRTIRTQLQRSGREILRLRKHFISSSAKTRAKLKAQTKILTESGLFDEQYYLSNNPDVREAGVPAAVHFLLFGAAEGRFPNPLFDPAFYLAAYPDVDAGGINPLLHYIEAGAAERRAPGREFDTGFYLDTYPDIAQSGCNPLRHFLHHGASEGRLPRPPHDTVALKQLEQPNYIPLRRRDDWRLAGFHPDIGPAGSLEQSPVTLSYRPLISVLMPTFNTPPVYLEAAVRSVLAQTYPTWELCIVDDGSSNTATLEALDLIASWDERISVIRNSRNEGISQATNAALAQARGDYVAMVDHDDELTEEALYEVALALNNDPSIDVIYTDQDYISAEGKPVGHLLKPDWSPQLFRGVMFVGHLLTVRRSTAVDAGAFDSAYDFVQDFEFMLRVSERTRNIRHIPKVLYHWRRIPESVAGGGKADKGIERLQAAAVQAHLDRLGLKGRATPNPQHPHRVIIEPQDEVGSISLDVFIHGQATSERGIASIENTLIQAPYCKARLVLPDGRFRQCGDKTATGTIPGTVAPLLSESARLWRLAYASTADFMLISSADVWVEATGWLERLLPSMQEPDVAVVCATVLSPDGLVSHAGWIIGPDGEMLPAMRGFDPKSDGFAGSMSCAREISLCSADFVLLRRSAVIAHLSKEPTYLSADFLIADLVLRMTQSGLRAICLPSVNVLGSAQNELPSSTQQIDRLIFQDIWAKAAGGDPFYNPNFAADRADYT